MSLSEVIPDEEESESFISIASSRTKKPRKLRASDLDVYCREFRDGEPEFDCITKQRMRYCMVDEACCSYANSVVTNHRKHLLSKHGIDTFPKLSTLQVRTAKLIKDIGTSESDDPQAKQELEKAMFESFLNPSAIQEALVRLIIVRSLPFSLVEWEELQALISLCNPIVKIPQSHNTIRLAVFSLWREQKGQLSQILRTAVSKIHISLDVWTSPNTYLFLGIVAHFVRDGSSKRSKALLGLREINGHAGEGQWEILLPVLYEFDIVRRLGTIVGDNASTNGTLCRTISNWFEDEELDEWSAETNQIRCIGHILNLIVQAFFDKDLKEYEAYDKAEQEMDSEETSPFNQNNPEMREKFRTEMDILGKIHNIVVHIRSSGGRTKQWLSIARRRIPLDNRTRWNSWYEMIQIAILLERDINHYVSLHNDLELDALSSAEWEWLRITCTFLQGFHNLTLQNEGDQKGISLVLLTLQIVESYAKVAKSRYEQIPGTSIKQKRIYISRVDHCLKTAWKKWWNLLWDHPLYLIASVLNPGLRTNFITGIFQNSGSKHRELDTTKKLKAVKQIWLDWLHNEQKYQRSYKQKFQKARRTTSYQIQQAKNESIYKLGMKIIPSLEPVSEKDWYDQYISEGAYEVEDVLGWWIADPQHTRWPDLSRFAIEILSIPAMSDEPERVFSGARRTITWERASLKPDIIEALECSKHFCIGQRSSKQTSVQT